MPRSRPLKAHEWYRCPLCQKDMQGQQAKTKHHQEPGLCQWPRGYANTGNSGWKSGWKREAKISYNNFLKTGKGRFTMKKGD